MDSTHAKPITCCGAGVGFDSRSSAAYAKRPAQRSHRTRGDAGDGTALQTPETLWCESRRLRSRGLFPVLQKPRHRDVLGARDEFAGHVHEAAHQRDFARGAVEVVAQAAHLQVGAFVQQTVRAGQGL